MAIVLVREAGIRLEDERQVADFCRRQDIYYERWDADRLAGWERDPGPKLSESDQARIISAYEEEIKRLAERRAYLNWDAVLMSDAAPELLAKFGTLHTHHEEEVRVLADGGFAFVIRNVNGDGYFELHVEEGDVFALPANRPHAFKLGPQRKAVVVRLFSGEIGSVMHPFDDPSFEL